MKRVLLQGGPPAGRLASGERLRLNAIVADDMGEDAGEVGMPIHVSVTLEEMGPYAPESSEHGHAGESTHTRTTADDLTGLHIGAQPLEAGSFIVVPRGQHGVDPPPSSPELTLQPSRSAGDASCSFSVQFSEALHSSSTTCDGGDDLPTTSVLVTVSAPGSHGVLPLTIGPVLLLPSTEPQQRSAPPAAWSRELRRQCGGSDALSLRLLEQNAREGGIDSSLWDAGLVLGAYLSHMWATDRPSIGFRMSLDLHQAQEGPEDDSDQPKGMMPLDASSKAVAVELGCGTGCAGLMLAGAMKAFSVAGNPGDPVSSGSSSSSSIGGTVLLTDGSPEAAGIAQRNAELNGLSRHSRAGLLRWGEHQGAAADVAATAAAATLVFAADVVYDERMFWPLVETLQALALGSLATLEQNRGDAAAAAAAAAVDDDGGDCCGARCSLDAASAGAPDAAEVVLAYRLRTEPKSAEHFWHLLTSCFEVSAPVGDGVLEAALSAWGMDRSPLEEGVSVYHLKPRPRDAASRRDVGCLYCQRMLMPQSYE